MPVLKLEQIADDLIAKAAAIVGARSTGLMTDVGKMWEQEPNTPAAYVGRSEEEKTGAPTRSIESVAVFFWHTICRGEAPSRSYNALYQSLQQSIDNDPSLGGLAVLAIVTGDSVMNTPANIAKRVHVANVRVSVTYRHARGSP